MLTITIYTPTKKMKMPFFPSNILSLGSVYFNIVMWPNIKYGKFLLA